MRLDIRLDFYLGISTYKVLELRIPLQNEVLYDMVPLVPYQFNCSTVELHWPT